MSLPTRVSILRSLSLFGLLATTSLQLRKHGPGVADDEVLAIASDRRSLLITQDKDFGELVFRLGQASSGVLLLRLSGVVANEKAGLAADALRDHGIELVAAFSVLDRLNLRIRPHGV